MPGNTSHIHPVAMDVMGVTQDTRKIPARTLATRLLAERFPASSSASPLTCELTSNRDSACQVGIYMITKHTSNRDSACQVNLIQKYKITFTAVSRPRLNVSLFTRSPVTNIYWENSKWILLLEEKCVLEDVCGY